MESELVQVMKAYAESPTLEGLEKFLRGIVALIDKRERKAEFRGFKRAFEGLGGGVINTKAAFEKWMPEQASKEKF